MSAKNALVATYAKSRLAEADIRKLHAAGLGAGLALVGGRSESTATVEGFGELDAAARSCIPEEDIQAFEAEARAGRVVLVAHGAAEDIVRAQGALASPLNWDESAGYTVYYGCGD